MAINKSIILIGADGVGKSTLAADLSVAFNTPVFHGSHKHEDKVLRTNDLLLQAEVTPMIFDRIYPIDDLVYSNVLGLESDVQLTSYIRRLCDTDRFIILYLINDEAEAIIRERGDDYIEPEHIQHIKNEYSRVLLEYNVPHTIVAMNFARYDEALPSIVQHLTRLARNKY